MENQTNEYSALEKWLQHLRWKPCVVGVIIGCACTSVIGLSIGLIAHPYLMSFSSCWKEQSSCSNDIHWEPCSSHCGNGIQTGLRQTRQTVDGECVITSNTTISRLCASQQKCQLNGEWGSWEQFGLCSTTCGTGVIPIVRRCDSPTPKNGGKYCEGEGYSLGSCSMKACPEKNIALKKETSQSSKWTLKPTSIMTSFLGVDGIVSQKDGNSLCTHTDSTYPAWWAVDLGDMYDINRVVIYGRSDCCSDRFKNFDIDVFKPLPNERTTFDNFQLGIMTRCYYQPGEVQNHVLNATCSQGTTGQFVRVRLRDENFLSMCEIEVYSIVNPLKLTVDNKFMYSKPYFGPDAREIRGVKREKNCTNRCQSDANQDCMTLFLPHHSTCVIIGGT